MMSPFYGVDANSSSEVYALSLLQVLILELNSRIVDFATPSFYISVAENE